jgi:uncharacterized protein
MYKPASPPKGAPHGRDLTDNEFAELDDLLHATPEPLEPLDAVMLDGFLCGVLVQPALIDSDQWMPFVFDSNGQELPQDADPAWLARVQTLVTQRHAALNRAMAEHGWFDPLILEDDDSANPAEPSSSDDATAPPVDSEDQASNAAFDQLPPISKALMPWVAGFLLATEHFPALTDMPDDAVHVAMARLYRHLPANSPEEVELVATLDRERPLRSMDQAIEELVVSVADLWDLTRKSRYHVATVKRDTPKLGRNDPCHCGSGKKFKSCHGKT